MTAAIRNWTLEQGASWQKGVVVKLNGVPVDSTWRVRAQIRKAAGSPVLYAFSDELGNASLVDGIVRLWITPAQSAAFVWTTGRYDVEIFNPTGTVHRILTGAFTVLPDITRS